MDESPRWLIVRGDHRRAREVLERAARWNKMDLPPPEELDALMKNIQKEVRVGGGESWRGNDQEMEEGVIKKEGEMAKRRRE